MKSRNIAIIRLLILKQDKLPEPKKEVIRVYADKGRRLALIACLACMMSSCGFIAGGNTDGYTVSCNGAGCSKFTEYATALITETKHDGKDGSAYWAHRKAETERVTWMESLFGKRSM